MDDSIPKVSEYKRLRTISQGVADKLAKRVDQKSLHEAGEALGMVSRGTLVFSSENELPILYDYCVFQQRVNGKNVVERFVEESPPDPNSDEAAVLRANLAAYYSIFEILGVERGAGVYVKDLVRGETRFLADIGLSNTGRVGGIIATRVVRHPGMLMTTGAALPMTREQFVPLISQLETLKGLGSGELTSEQETALATKVIGQALRSGFSTQVQYAEAGAGFSPPRVEPARPRATGRRAGRNDPCPCGSGKKFKACCGRN